MQAARNGTRTDNMNGISSLGARDTDQKVVGLDVAINERLLMDGLHTGHLCREHSYVSNLDSTDMEDEDVNNANAAGERVRPHSHGTLFGMRVILAGCRPDALEALHVGYGSLSAKKRRLLTDMWG